MKKLATSLCLAASLITTSLVANAETQAPEVWKMTYSSIDSDLSAQFCVDVLGMERIEIPDPTLANGRAWVKFPESALELHFVDARSRYGYVKTKEYYEYIDNLDQDMTVFTTFMDNHGAILVDDLSPYLERLTKRDQPYLGPVRRADGVYQLYIEVPGYTYLELDSRKAPADKYATTTWDKVPFAPENHAMAK